MSNKAIFLSRDNTLVEASDYITSADQVKLLGGVPKALIELGAMGYKLIVVSNQSAVARGIVTEKALGQIHNRLKQLLVNSGAHLDRIYYCPYHPDAVIPKYRKETDARKPSPGMLLTASYDIDIDLGQSWMIGSSSSDVEAGLRAGCKTILLDNPSHEKQLVPGRPNPDYQAVNINEAVNIIKKYHRSSDKHTAQTQPSPTAQAQPSPQVIEETHQPEPVESAAPQAHAPEQNISSRKIEHLLSGITRQLKGMQRADMFNEFSIMRLMAGIVQILVLFCLLITVWLLMSPTRQDNSVLITLGFAMVLQMMALTFYIMQRRK